MAHVAFVHYAISNQFIYTIIFHFFVRRMECVFFISKE